jgi:predicted glutamine amidotransferase
MLQSFCADASTTAVQSESISVATTGQSLVLVASVPLTADAWQPLTSGQIVVVREGRVITPVA